MKYSRKCGDSTCVKKATLECMCGSLHMDDEFSPYASPPHEKYISQHLRYACASHGKIKDGPVPPGEKGWPINDSLKHAPHIDADSGK